MNLILWIWAGLRRIPIFGPLHGTKFRDHSEAFRELALTMLVSTSPLWGGAVILCLRQGSSSPDSFWHCLSHIIVNGELFIYAASTVAPVIYMTIRDRQGARGFPSKASFIGFAILCAFLSCIVFTNQRVWPKTLPDSMVAISVWLFAASVVMVYLAHVYNNSVPPNAAMAMREEEVNYERQLRQRRP